MRSVKEDRFCETALFTGDPCGFGKMFVENVFAPRHVYLFLTEGIKINGPQSNKKNVIQSQLDTVIPLCFSKDPYIFYFRNHKCKCFSLEQLHKNRPITVLGYNLMPTCVIDPPVH